MTPREIHTPNRVRGGAVGPDLSGRLAVVVGLGTSGQAAVELLLSRGARVIATDSAPEDQMSGAVRRLGETGAELILGTHEGVSFAEADLVVVSPGVPSFARLERAEEGGVEVIGETELASRYLEVPICAIGGTNGKSTATTLVGHMLEGAERRVFVGGNLGDPACEAPDQGMDNVVLEVSSFQMERLVSFRPHVAVLLNVSEDHLDRYPDFDGYVRAKGNCFERQQAEDFAIYPVGDERCRAQVSRGRGTQVTFGAGGDYFVEGHRVIERASGLAFDLQDTDLHGGHNYLNAAAAIAAARCLGIGQESIEEGLFRFRALPHRMALAGRYKDVVFYDDSKATNVGAAVTALSGLTEPRGVLIAGGRDKHGDLAPLIEALKKKGRAVVLLGEAAPRLAEAIGEEVPVQQVRTIQGAVVHAFRLAQPGDAVLLSPACSSLDMFKNYAERGKRFTESVENLSRLLEESPA